MEEEIALLEEQLATAHADIGRLQEQLADASARAAARETEALDLRRELAQARSDLGEREGALSGRESEIEDLRASLEQSLAQAEAAAGRYRDLLLAAEPDLPSDMVQGDSVESIDAAAERARQTVARVREHLEGQAQALRVPAGAPPRSAPDLVGLTPAEKIRAGIEGR